MTVKISDPLVIFKKFRAKYIVRKMASIAIVIQPKGRPEKKSKHRAAIATWGK
jgi:hypothetical protein